MNNMNMDQNQQYQQYYGNGMPMSPMPYGAPYLFNPNTPVPLNQNALSEQEIDKIKKKSNLLDLSCSEEDMLRAMCTHKHNGTDVVQQLNDGSVYCPICGEKWSKEFLEQDEVQEIIDKVNSAFQNAKWVGDLPTEVVRQYFPILNLINKFGALNKYAMNNLNKYMGCQGVMPSQDLGVYAMFNSLVGGGAPYNPYAQQPMMPYQPVPQNAQVIQPQQQTQYYYNAPVANPMDASSYYQPQQIMQPVQQPQQVVPQQIPAQQPTQQVVPQQIPVQQPTQSIQQGYPPIYRYAPVTEQQPAQSNQQQNTVTKNEKVTV